MKLPLLAPVSALFLVGVGAVFSDDARPNFIVIYSDDHGYSDLGIHGLQADLKTPHLDSLARGGVVVKNGYSTAPQCVPSRGGLLTGRFQGRFGLDNNNSSLDGFNRQTTLAERLSDAGYVTAQFGKWHLGPTTEITGHGFKHVFSQNAQRPFSANITIDGIDRPLGDLPSDEYHLAACAKAASAIIDRYHDQPFFLYLAFRGPHTPLDAPQIYKDRFPGEMPERRRAALGMLAAIDDGVGLITSTLERHGLTEKTLIFFIGDNGAPLKIHKIDSPLEGDPGGWDGSLNEPLNGEKGMLSEGGMHVPFLISWPGKIPGGQIYEHPVSALDVAATAVAAGKVEAAQGELDGIDLMPFLTGERKEAPHEALYWRWMAQSAIREGNWKLLRGGEREYLYDLSTDIEEKDNLAARNPEIASRLRGKLSAWCAELDPPGLALGPMSPVWNDYFDHYLEGKTLPLPAAKDTSSEVAVRGWVARGGRIAEENGLIVFLPDKKGKGGFLTKNRVKLAGPVKVRLEMRAAPGKGWVSWRVEGEKDFLPENRVP
ncbi:MAG: sulfatase-like hydrolase/transferase, partial [Verrucomicrobiae bacterium]|nr:sulfatase-like hydrolase/transferase [Verrucomicrobiae bacterium]